MGERATHPFGRLSGLLALLAVVLVLGNVTERRSGIWWTGSMGSRDGAGQPANPGYRSEAAGSIGDPIVGSSDGSESDSAVPLRDSTDWWSVLETLDRSRGVAFERVDASLLDAVNEAGSPPMSTDAMTIRNMARAGVRAAGFSAQVLGIESVKPCGPVDGDACLLIVDSRGPYELIDGSGGLVRRVPGTDRERWLVQLTPSPSGSGEAMWLIKEVLHVP